MDSLQGCVLIASPKLGEPTFAGTVIFIVQHEAQGALGLVLNRPREHRLAVLAQQLGHPEPARDQTVGWGGPCEGPMMALYRHEDGSAGPDELQVAFTADPHDVGELIADPPEEARFFLGYAGWSAGQLESELAARAWLMGQLAPEMIFQPPEGAWTRIIQQVMGIPNLHPEHLPEDPSLN